MSDKVKKYLFDLNNFDAPPEPEEPETPPPPMFSEEELNRTAEEFQKKGFDEGKSAGIGEVRGSLEQQIANNIGLLTEKIEFLAQEELRRFEMFEQETLKAILHIFEKVYPDFDALNKERGVEAFVRKTLAENEAVASFEILLHPDQRKKVEEALAPILQGNDRLKIVYRDDADIAQTDIKIKWSDGGAERQMEAIKEAVTASITRFIKPEEAESKQSEDNMALDGNDDESDKALEESPDNA